MLHGKGLSDFIRIKSAITAVFPWLTSNSNKLEVVNCVQLSNVLSFISAGLNVFVKY